MSIELRILSGARAGQSQSFEKSVVAIGRHPLSDLRFDVNHDLDVSTNHGEIRGLEGKYLLYDSQSTNGTFVNRERLPSGGSRELRDGDVVGFGETGPTVSVRISQEATTPRTSTISKLKPIPERASAAIAAPVAPPTPAPSHYSPSQGPPTQRRPTVERVAIEVKKQTLWLRVAVGVTVVVLGGLAAGVYYNARQQAAAQNEQMQKLVAANEATTRALETRLSGMNDTALTNGLRRSTDSLARAVREARGAAASAEVMRRLQINSEAQRKLTEMDMPAVRDANDPAIALIATEISGAAFEATGFSVSSAGLIITNRHVVADSTGQASRIGVKFANTGIWHHAHLVKVGDGSVDLALVQVDEKGPYPYVHGIERTIDTPVGGTTLTLGFPDGTDLPMEGKGNDLVAKTTLVPGTVSKSMSDLLQINSFATHGSSGSPVFDGHGHVIGVVKGGVLNTPIVYAVPGSQIAELLKGVK